MSADFEGLKTGSHPPYQWLATSEHYSGDFVRLCPEVFIGRSLVISAIDSGDPRLTEVQQLAGWELRSGLVYSPPLSSTGEVFYQRDGPDCQGWDEWYLFDEKDVDLGELVPRLSNVFEVDRGPRHVMSFVGFPDFLALTDPTWQVITAMLWQQLEWAQPESYVADGMHYLAFITRNPALFEAARDRLSADAAIGD